VLRHRVIFLHSWLPPPSLSLSVSPILPDVSFSYSAIALYSFRFIGISEAVNSTGILRARLRMTRGGIDRSLLYGNIPCLIEREKKSSCQCAPGEIVSISAPFAGPAGHRVVG